MFGKTVAKLALAASVMVSAIAWAAAPSADQVYQAAQAGNYAQAQSLMDQVLRDHPDSAKAHFVEAELLARQGKLAAARSELDTAQKLDPSLTFAKPTAVQELKTLLAGNSAANGGNRQARSTGGQQHMSWLLILAVVIIFVVGIRFLRRTFGRSAGGYYGGPAGMPMSGGPAGPVGPMGYGGGAMMPPAAGGMGLGLMGGLATGAAVGAGMVAGEALMHRVLDGGSHQSIIPDSTAFTQNDAASSYDMGGNDFGLNDAGSWDNGNAGGDSWGGGSGGGSDDDWS